MTLRLRTFGTAFLERDRVPLGGVHAQRRRLALLTLLAAAEGGPVARHKLIALLWPERDEASGRHSLSQLLYALRQELGSGAIAADKGTVRLDPAVVSSDIGDFERALRVGALADAVMLYRGPFLDGFYLDDAPDFERWVEEQRAQRLLECARALDTLANEAWERGELTLLVEWRRQRSALDPLDAGATARLVEALTAAGDRHGALQTARAHEARMRDEFDAPPDASVTRLAARLRHDLAGSHDEVPHDQSVKVAGSTRPPSPASSLPPPLPTAVQAHGPEPHRLVGDRPSRRRTVIAAAATIMVAIGVWRGPLPPGPPRPAVRVLLGELAGADSTLGLAVREAVRAELSATRSIHVAGDAYVRELQTLMRLAPDAPLDVPALLDLATRGGAHFVVTGSVAPLGTGAQIVLDLHDPATGRALATLAARPADQQAILRAVTELGRDLRATISDTPRDSTVEALPAVATRSLPALRSYAQARRSAARGHRDAALRHAERAVLHDSTFVLAHYLLGDLLWFLDDQARSVEHLRRAVALSERAPLRERLTIRARHAQLVQDEPDSALHYWTLLQEAFPDEVLVHEGRAWTLRSLGRHREAAAAATAAIALDSTVATPNTNNALYSWLALGDTASALSFARAVHARNPNALDEARFFTALARGDYHEAMAVADSTSWLSARLWRRQLVSLSRGDLAAAEQQLDSLRADDAAQYLPRALVAHGWVELARTGNQIAARQKGREAFRWLRSRALSPPAIARIAERIGELAARSGDVTLIRELATLVAERDAGRSLRSYRAALAALAGFRHFAQGHHAAAARQLGTARQDVYFWRSIAPIVLLEADARRATGDSASGDALEQLVHSRQVVDGDFETAALLRVTRAAATRPMEVSRR